MPRPTWNIGEFCIHHTWLYGGRHETSWKKLVPVFNKLVVIRCESRMDWMRFQYSAFSSMFREVEQGYNPTYYEIQVKLTPLCEIVDVRAVEVDRQEIGRRERNFEEEWKSLTEHY